MELPGSIMGMYIYSLTGWRPRAQQKAEGSCIGIGSHSHLEQGETEQAIHAGQQGREGKQARAMVLRTRTRADLLLGTLTVPQGRPQ